MPFGAHLVAPDRDPGGLLLRGCVMLGAFPAPFGTSVKRVFYLWPSGAFGTPSVCGLRAPPSPPQGIFSTLRGPLATPSAVTLRSLLVAFGPSLPPPPECIFEALRGGPSCAFDP